MQLTFYLKATILLPSVAVQYDVATVFQGNVVIAQVCLKALRFVHQSRILSDFQFQWLRQFSRFNLGRIDKGIDLYSQPLGQAVTFLARAIYCAWYVTVPLMGTIWPIANQKRH